MPTTCRKIVANCEQLCADVGKCGKAGQGAVVSLQNQKLKTQMKIPDTIKGRHDLLCRELYKLKNKASECPCLGLNVIFKKKFIDEMIYRAESSEKTTIYALGIKKALKKAKYHRMVLPKDNGKQSDFIFVYILKAEMADGNNAKILVGVKETPLSFLQYTITDFDLH